MLERNITLPGLSPLFPAVHCTKSGEICQVVLGESEINAASTMSALVLAPEFNLKQTYFLVGGIAGINPETASICDVTFARYAVQVALQYEFDARELPSNFSTGYFPQGANSPSQYPQSIYGTEVFEFNVKLRDIAAGFARKAKLSDTDISAAYRAKYAKQPKYKAATQSPRVRTCDVATSDVYFSGTLLGEAFGNYTKLVTNGTGVYCTTAQEDNATGEVLLRAALAKLVDFSRLIVMRTGSDFDRPPLGESDLQNLVYVNQNAFEPSLQNIYLAGREVIKGITGGWKQTFERGVAPENYVGDIFDSLAGVSGKQGGKYKPDFGLPSAYLSATGIQKRALGEAEAPRSRMELLKRRGGVMLPSLRIDA